MKSIRKFFGKIASWCRRNPIWCHLILLLILTLLMGIWASLFYINSFMNHPQFTRFEEFYFIMNQINLSGKKIYYYLFFLTDAIWAITLLTFFRRLLKTIRKYSSFSHIKDIVITVFTVFMVAAYLSDLFEGFIYVFGCNVNFNDVCGLLKTTVNIKKGLYGFTGVIFLYGIYKYWSSIRKGDHYVINDHRKSIRIFLRSSFLSLLFVAIVALLLTQIPQGKTIVIDLLDRPRNLFGVYLLLCFLALILSHYPAYFEARRKEIRDLVDWKIITKGFLGWFPRLTGLGVVYYTLKDENKNPFDKLAKIFRHHLGGLMFIAFLFILFYTGQQAYEGFKLHPALSLFVFFISILFYDYLRKKSNNPKSWFIAFAVFAGVSIIASVWVVAAAGWSRGSLYLTSLAAIALLGLYITFRIFRKDLFGKSNRSLVIVFSIFGFLSLALIVFANVNLSYPIRHLNAVSILLLYIVIFYGFIAVLVKHIQLYNEKNIEEIPGKYGIKKRFSWWRYVLPTVPFFLLLWLLIVNSFPNKLHYMKKIPEKSSGDVMKIEDFGDYIEKADSTSDQFPYYFLATSYGGGLMANLWAMLVYNEIQRTTSGRFLKSTINMSGNSGGTIGLGNYANLWTYNGHFKEEVKADSIIPQIEGVGNFNHLSIDLTYLFGWDMIRELIPFISRKEGRDRSYEAMKRYAELTGDKNAVSLHDRSYRQHWKYIFDENGYYPSLTFSTTSIDGQLGNVFSLKTADHNEIFRGIYNVLDTELCDTVGSVSYYQALSASNRFPIFSPIASIKGEGHFVDGGYYDNSGLMNSLEFLNYLFTEAVITDSSKVRYVIVENSKSHYIQYLLGEWIDRYKKEKKEGEIPAIVKTVTKVDKVSRHLKERIKNEFDSTVFIHLPHRFTYDDVVNTFHGDPINPFTVQKIIDCNNEWMRQAIDSAIENKIYDKKWGIVESPLARILSEPAVRYQRAMVEYHPLVRRQVQQIGKWFGNKSAGESEEFESKCCEQILDGNFSDILRCNNEGIVCSDCK